MLYASLINCLRLLRNSVFLSCVFVTFSLIKGYKTAEDFASRKNIDLFYKFKPLIDFIFSEETADKYKTQLLFIKYDKDCMKEKHLYTPYARRKPFIELECNNDTARKILLEKLAKRIRGVVLEHPAKCLREVSGLYNEQHPLYGAFCSLSMYITAYDATIRFHDAPVIISGYWLEKAAYFISKGYENDSLPEYRSSVYDYPPDLLLPDIAFSVHYEDLPGVSNKYIKRHQEAMSMIDGPVLFEIKPDMTHDAMVRTMVYEMIKGFSSNNLDLSFIIEE